MVTAGMCGVHPVELLFASAKENGAVGVRESVVAVTTMEPQMVVIS
jgi:hypothetical protein